MKGRYFYFEANGSSANQGTHLTEVQIFDYDGNNLALGRGVLRYSGYDTGAQPPSAVTDGNTDCSKHFDMGLGQHYAVIDLGAVYHVSHIKVWRYYDGSRYYKDVYIKVSEDDTNYQTVFSSTTHGTYVETASGYQIDLPYSSDEVPKYYRLTITNFGRNGSGNQTYANMAELAFYDESGNNLSLLSGASYSANTQMSNQKASVAFDGNKDTYWHSNWSSSPNTTNWLQAYLPTESEVVSFGITPHTDGSNLDYPIDFILASSSDGSSWNTIYQGTGLSSGWSKGVERLFTIDSSYEPPKRFLYNGISLPALPEEALNNYKYAWIGKNTSSGYYDLIFSNLRPYYHTDNNIGFGDGTTADTSWYRIGVTTAEYASEWTFNKDDNTWYGLSSRTLVWSNCDILNGSISATKVYFRGSLALSEDYTTKLLSVVEAESGIVADGAIVSDRASTSGNIVVDLIMYSSGSLTLNFKAPRDDYYIIKAYFTCDTRYFNYTLNGKTYTDKVIGSGFSSIDSVEFQMYLLQGNNTIVITGNSNSTYAPMFDKFEIYDLATITIKYLIRCASKLYTVVDDALSELENNELSAELFNEYGIEYPPSGELFIGLVDPELLYWQEDNGLPPILHLTVIGVPPIPQVIVTEAYDMSHETILGISSVVADASEDVLFAISFDGGITWKAYDGTQWNTLESESDGMSKNVMNAITEEAWSEVTTGTSYMFRFTLTSADSYMQSIVVDYLN